jgi:hypothetical protein
MGALFARRAHSGKVERPNDELPYQATVEIAWISLGLFV